MVTFSVGLHESSAPAFSIGWVHLKVSEASPLQYLQTVMYQVPHPEAGFEKKASAPTQSEQHSIKQQ